MLFGITLSKFSFTPVLHCDQISKYLPVATDINKCPGFLPITVTRRFNVTLNCMSVPFFFIFRWFDRVDVSVIQQYKDATKHVGLVQRW